MKSPTLLAAALLLAGLAQADEPAPNADRRALNAAVQRDAKGNQSAAASVSLPVGRSAWVQAGVGQSRSRDAASGNRYKPTQASIGGGMAGKGWQASLNASQRRDGGALRQNDVAAALDWKPTNNVNLGLDAAHRDARARGTLPAAGGGAATPAEQRVKGHGVGVHGAVAVTQRLTVYGATMRNHYKTSTTQTAPSNGGLLAPLLPNRVSAINRDEAALARSHQLGATYRVTDRVALNGEVLQDRLLDGGNLRSAQVKAAIDAGAGWTLTPGIGRSRGPQGGVKYGSLAASYAW
jgi:hypothetical protein